MSFNEWFQYTIEKSKNMNDSFQVDEMLDFDTFALYKDVERWFNQSMASLEKQPEMLECKNFTDNPKYENKKFNNNHGEFAKYLNKDPKYLYTTDLVVYDGKLHEWDMKCKIYRFVR